MVTQTGTVIGMLKGIYNDGSKTHTKNSASHFRTLAVISDCGRGHHPVFVAFDPQLIMVVSGYGDISRLGGYTMGFFFFWMLTSTSCALTCYFRKPTDGIGKKQ